MICTIELEEMDVYAFHGCYEEEQRVGNRFVVNVTLETDCTNAANTDDIKQALNYVEVNDVVRHEMAIKSHLLENVVSRIIDSLHKKFPQLITVKVKVSKMAPPVNGQVRCVSVTMVR